MFNNLIKAPEDPIFGIVSQFKKDPRQEKVNLAIGAYKTENLKSFIPESVHLAEQHLLKKQLPKDYSPIEGSRFFNNSVLNFLLKSMGLQNKGKNFICFQTLGGTGALRIAGDFLFLNEFKDIFIPSPTWANHNAIFSEAGLSIKQYPYYDKDTFSLETDKMFSALSKLPEKSLVLFHTNCHNPSGLDLLEDHWKALVKLVKDKKLLVIFDCAYHGFKQNLQKDLSCARIFAENDLPFFLAYSFSKNLGLYGERVGALCLHLPTKNLGEAEKISSHIQRLIRRSYSNPPIHGANIVCEVLNKQELSSLWESELEVMRNRIIKMRSNLMKSLQSKKTNKNFSFMEKQSGMFCFCGITKQGAEKLRKEFAIYLPDSGRINVAGLNGVNIDYISESIKKVME